MHRNEDEFSTLQLYKTRNFSNNNNNHKKYKNNYSRRLLNNQEDYDYHHDDDDDNDDDNQSDKYCCDCPCCKCRWCLVPGVWCVKDVCGMVCACITWMLIFYGEFVVMFVIIIPAPYTIGNLINALIFNMLAFLALASHSAAMFTDPGSVPLGNATPENIEKATQYPGQVIYRCPRCLSIKPLRAHHCSVCKRCIRKMDHHCPWYV